MAVIGTVPDEISIIFKSDLVQSEELTWLKLQIQVESKQNKHYTHLPFKTKNMGMTDKYLHMHSMNELHILPKELNCL